MCKFFFQMLKKSDKFVVGRLQKALARSGYGVCVFLQKPRISPIPLVIQTAPMVVMVYMTISKDCSAWNRQ